MKYLLIISLLLNSISSFSQNEKLSGKSVDLPYNRRISSAGNVFTFGDSILENHTLDLTLLPDKKNIAIEDRYGFAVFNSQTKKLVTRWSFRNANQKKNLMSTYSGITSVLHNDKTYIIWGAASSGGESAIMIAEWANEKVNSVTSIPIEKKAPAKLALPNQVVTNLEEGELYIYTVLNGNNELIKIRFDDQKLMWSVPTEAAPYGLCIINKMAYITNWAGKIPSDLTKESAGIPWGAAYTEPSTGATMKGTLSIFEISNGKRVNDILLGFHPNTIISSPDKKLLYITNSNNDEISVINVAKQKLIESIPVGLFNGKKINFIGSSPNALCIDSTGKTLYVANGMDNAIAIVKLGKSDVSQGRDKTTIQGYIPTEAYPSGVLIHNNNIYITNLEARGASVYTDARDIEQPSGKFEKGFAIHQQLASFSVIPIPTNKMLYGFTESVKKMNFYERMNQVFQTPRKNMLAVPVPERIGEPSVFKHVIYIIKENKTFDQVFGDIDKGNGDEKLCIYGEKVTPNQHQLANDFCLLDNYYASGKSSAEGHSWADAGIVTDWVEKNVRAWFRSYPHRLEDALVYHKKGFLWNNALDHGKIVRIYGEACLSHYTGKIDWESIYKRYKRQEQLNISNTSTIARIRPVISPDYPDCDNINFTDQIRADVFIKEWKSFEKMNGDQLPNLMILSLPNDHTAGMSSSFPTPRAMVADNDLALGRIIETISTSRFWDSTVVFVTEDDSQSGWDHVSPYRTTGIIISPYTIQNKLVHTNYNQTSMVRTIEQILGIPPMNVIDATALPMFDCFENKKNRYQYLTKANTISLNEMNKPLNQLSSRAFKFAKLSEISAFKEVDGGDDDTMNQILWYAAKGNEPYPQFLNKNFYKKK